MKMSYGGAVDDTKNDDAIDAVAVAIRNLAHVFGSLSFVSIAFAFASVVVVILVGHSTSIDRKSE